MALIVERSWERDLAEVVQAAGGVLTAAGRIPADQVEEIASVTVVES